MSGHNPLREDKTCLNCRHVVEKRFCPNCGQENSDSRKTFYQLFVHFFEDLTHYENSFWKTIRHLLFKPGRLTKEYLSGKRLSYLAPIRLYIFISFMTFFLLSVLPETPEEPQTEGSPKKGLTVGKRDSIAAIPIGKDTIYTFKSKGNSNFNFYTPKEIDTSVADSGRTIKGFGTFKTVKEFDSIQKSLPGHKKLKGWQLSIERQMAVINEKTADKDFEEKFGEALMHNIPKALFLYMPIFAFWLWLFHGKKRWYYFDHGIFTLHYFSFLLLTSCVLGVVGAVFNYIDSDILQILLGFLYFGLFGWWFFYFFRSHSRFYGEPKVISRLKGLVLYFINMFFISIFVLGLLYYTLIYIH